MYPTTALVPLILIPVLSLARDVTFPSLAAAHTHQIPIIYSGEHDLNDIDIVTGSEFAGLTTFANLPYASCFSVDEGMKGEEERECDVAFLGAPFDTSVTARPGARFGPRGIRIGSQRMAAAAGWNVYTGENPFMNWARIIDCGDAPLTFLDNTIALKQLEKAHKVISARTARTRSKSSTPRIITLGGDHTTTLAALRSAYLRWGKVSVIHFDSHIDTWDPDVLGGGVSHYAGINHGTFLHLAHEEGLIRNTSIHAGIRAPLVRHKGDMRNDVRCGFETVKARDIDRLGIDGIIKKLRDRIAGTRVYVSVDIDVLDPAFAPATGTAEVGGWSTRELLSVLDGLAGIDIIGADVVEVAPIYDNPGETTVLAAAEVALSLLTLMIDTPVKP